MSRAYSMLSVIVASAVAIAGIGAVPACSYTPPAVAGPEGFAPPPGDDVPRSPHGLKIEVPVSDPADTNRDGTVSHKESKAAAQSDFRHTVKVGTGWLAGLFSLASVALFVLSFFVATIPTRHALVGVGLAGVTWVARYMLLAYGTLAADIVAWACIVLLGLSLIGIVWVVVVWWRNRIAVMQGKQLAAEGKPREATALLAVGNEWVNERRAEVAATLGSLDSMTKEERAKATAKLREWGVKL
jgi:hypothetical protein